MGRYYSTGEMAVLMVIAYDIAKFGSCTRCVPEIARLAGGSETTVRVTVRKAVDLGHMYKEERRESPDVPNDTNVLTPRNLGWSAWIARGRVRKLRGDTQNQIYEPTMRDYEKAFTTPANLAVAEKQAFASEEELEMEEALDEAQATATDVAGFEKALEAASRKPSVLELHRRPASAGPSPVGLSWKPPVHWRQ
jgi:predicted transcriptional regulator